jgi:hypothetical protein
VRKRVPPVDDPADVVGVGVCKMPSPPVPCSNGSGLPCWLGNRRGRLALRLGLRCRRLRLRRLGGWRSGLLRPSRECKRSHPNKDCESDCAHGKFSRAAAHWTRLRAGSCIATSAPAQQLNDHNSGFVGALEPRHKIAMQLVRELPTLAKHHDKTAAPPQLKPGRCPISRSPWPPATAWVKALTLTLDAIGFPFPSVDLGAQQLP